jgi:hypothetical protein
MNRSLLTAIGMVKKKFERRGGAKEGQGIQEE